MAFHNGRREDFARGQVSEGPGVENGFDAISFPETTCLLVSTKTPSPCLGADQKARGLWERDWV